MITIDAELSRLEAILAADIENKPVDPLVLQASKVFRVPVSEVTGEQRRAVKSAYFALRYEARGDKHNG